MTSPIAYTQPNKGVQLELLDLDLNVSTPVGLALMATRPRTSILSLFDPLSLSSERSSSPDKENNAGETSFFHPSGTQGRKPATPLHTLRRRLIDVGDITVDEPDMQDLLEEEEELDQLHNIEEDDDGNTLTWKDMAKAATPKWSNRHATSFMTPKASPTPRTPLAELSFKDETTPMARKKSYGRRIIPTTSNLPQADDTPTCTIAISPPSPVKILNSPTSTSSRTHLSRNEPSDVDPDAQLAPEPTESLSSSVCTLNLPPATGTLIADTSLPLSISPTSSQSSLSPNAPLIHSPPTQARLRPTLDSQAHASHRHSADLQSSFQLHLSSADATFDLLNEKISFFSSKDGMESFLHGLEMDNSFGEDDFGPSEPSNVNTRQASTAARKPSASVDLVSPVTEEKPVMQCVSQIHNTSPPAEVNHIPSKAVSTVFTTQSGPAVIQKGPTISPHAVRSDTGANITGHRVTKSTCSIPRSSFDAKESNILSTLSSPRSTLNNPPPPPVPGLRIVKRAKILSRRLSTATNASTASTISSRTSGVPAESIPTSRAKPTPAIPSSPTMCEHISTDSDPSLPARAMKRSAVPAFPAVPLSGDGPRRVLISAGPKLSLMTTSRAAGYLEQAKSSSATGGPRRVVPPANMVEKPAVQVSTGLKQPVKYTTLGSTSAIPKPVSRIPGSRLPAPPAATNIKARFGAPTSATSALGKGLLGRRVT